MFILAQLWTYFLLACLLGAGAALLVRRACAGGPAMSRAAAPATGLTQRQQLEDCVRSRDEALQAARSECAQLQHDGAVQAERLVAAELEIDVLRRQVAASRAELAQVLNRRDLDTDALRAELAAAREALRVTTPG